MKFELAYVFQRRRHSKVWTDGRTDDHGQRTEVITLAHPEHLLRLAKKIIQVS